MLVLCRRQNRSISSSICLGAIGNKKQRHLQTYCNAAGFCSLPAPSTALFKDAAKRKPYGEPVAILPVT